MVRLNKTIVVEISITVIADALLKTVHGAGIPISIYLPPAALPF
jgi:uncharacterized protein (DUF427 family)